jgi:hypothetical protein
VWCELVFALPEGTPSPAAGGVDGGAPPDP